MKQNSTSKTSSTKSTAKISRRSMAAMTATALFAQPVMADNTVPNLIKLTKNANDALMRGDANTYRALLNISSDFTLMSPFGGQPSRASEYTPETWEKIGKFFKNGTFNQELVQAYGSPDMVVLALIERANVEVGDLPAQEWALRVTLVFQREGSSWRLSHRHADPLSHGISVAQAATLARGQETND
jgi:ketosteroid isomerase-like protein